MKLFLITVSLITLVLAAHQSLANKNEVDLYNQSSKPVAYIDLADGLTIYLWDGSPVAYLLKDSQGGYNIYGLNRLYLAWYIDNKVHDKNGNSPCDELLLSGSTR